jgi:hypothetical protein
MSSGAWQRCFASRAPSSESRLRLARSEAEQAFLRLRERSIEHGRLRPRILTPDGFRPMAPAIGSRATAQHLVITDELAQRRDAHRLPGPARGPGVAAERHYRLRAVWVGHCRFPPIAQTWCSVVERNRRNARSVLASGSSLILVPDLFRGRWAARGYLREAIRICGKRSTPVGLSPRVDGASITA